MIDLFKQEYVLEGEAIDTETIERIRDQIVAYAYEDMHFNGYAPQGAYPTISWEKNSRGYFDFIFKWKCYKI